jgi:hypothetical protein
MRTGIAVSCRDYSDLESRYEVGIALFLHIEIVRVGFYQYI